jgi:FkbM family methyltransferase
MIRRPGGCFGPVQRPIQRLQAENFNMIASTLEEANQKYEELVLALQYTIAQRERLKKLLQVAGRAAELYPSANASEIIDMILKTPAEHAQDVFAYIFSGCKREGFFVEFGACDGLAVSNTLSLEQRFGWTGILAEPSRFWRESLPRNRKATIDFRCVAGKTGQKVSFYESDRPCNSSSKEDHTHLGSVKASYDVETVSLMDLLDYHSAPMHIDYISIDTEGSEKEILEAFDFNKYKFGFITVEEHESVPPTKSVQPLLEQAGYRVIVGREAGRPVPMQISGLDKFYVPADHPALTWGIG